MKEVAEVLFPFLRFVLYAAVVAVFFQFGRLWERGRQEERAPEPEDDEEEDPPPVTRPRKVTSCPVETCNIQRPHSHTGDLIRRISEK